MLYKPNKSCFLFGLFYCFFFFIFDYCYNFVASITVAFMYEEHPFSYAFAPHVIIIFVECIAYIIALSLCILVFVDLFIKKSTQSPVSFMLCENVRMRMKIASIQYIFTRWMVSICLSIIHITLFHSYSFDYVSRSYCFFFSIQMTSSLSNRLIPTWAF